MSVPSLLLVGLVLLLIAGVAVWAVRRRRPLVSGAGAPRHAALSRPGLAARGDTDAAVQGEGGTPAGAGDALARELMGRFHSIAFEDGAFSQHAVVAGTAHADVVACSVATLSKIETQPRYTPRRPQLLPQLMRTVNDPNASGQAMAAIIARDPALAGNLLRIASSALYCVQSKPVENIAHAVAMVGTDGIRHLIAAALVQPVMGAPGGGAFGRLAGLIWDHTLMSAAAAADHAAQVERDDAFSAQLLGLMQGLGSATVARVARDQYARRAGLVPDASVVAALLDGWAAPTARRLAEKWSLPPRIRQALDDQQRGVAPDSPGRSLRFGRAAAALAMLCQHGRMEDGEALRLLASIEPRDHATVEIWKRLRRGADQR
ncbi:HDOD domain-containing protein [Lysobacter sp. F60174L2]|uniref:HDOD domain-containing protein n=1 Tax=Lysobacter sp. F60174L2 TaxID=3459295 RepID=UPI00403D83B5